jgi:hypothetical protein
VRDRKRTYERNNSVIKCGVKNLNGENKQEKNTHVVFSLLAMLLLLTSSFMAVSVNATNLAMQYGYYVGNIQGEKEAQEDACDELYWQFIWEFWDGCDPVNAYGEYTNEDDVGDCLDWQLENADYVTNWWVGDFYRKNVSAQEPLGHCMFYGYDSKDISDIFVYDHATDSGADSKNYFSFIWTCGNGGLYWNDPSMTFDNITGIIHASETQPTPGPTNTNDEYGVFNSTVPVGMPLGWTGEQDMALLGYSSSSGDYCYIGWEGTSPGMSAILNGSDCHGHAFPGYFYYKALGFDDPVPYYFHQSIRESLDYTAMVLYDEYYFDDTPLYLGYWESTAGIGSFFVRMRVFGNSDMIIPES